MDKERLQAAKELCYLLSCAVSGRTPDADRCAAMELRSVYLLAREHKLTACAAFALERCMELPRPFDQDKKKSIRRLALFDLERAQIVQGLEERGIRYLPLKGILLKDCYPKAAMREMSDNDLLCDSGRMEDIRELMEGLGYTTEMFGMYHHDTYSKPPTLEFEMHGMLFEDIKEPVFYSYYRGIKDRLIKDDGNAYGYHMTREDFYVYMLAHMYHHYSHAGTGLRSLLDIFVYRRRFPDLDADVLARELQTLGLTDFERDTRELAERLFDGEPLSEEEQKALAFFAGSGVYGTLENAEYQRLLTKLGDDSAESKRRYFRERIFMPREVMEEQYPFFARHRALVPALLVYRLGRAVVHPRRVSGELRRVKRFKKRK